jgi:hypothetical protein
MRFSIVVVIGHPAMIQDFAIKVPRVSWSFTERAIGIFSTLGKLAKRIPNYAKELEPITAKVEVLVLYRSRRNSPRGRLRAQSKEFLIKKYSDLYELCASEVK